MSKKKKYVIVDHSHCRAYGPLTEKQADKLFDELNPDFPNTVKPMTIIKILPPDQAFKCYVKK